ncbi:MAG: class I SAM-dependent methyltransferase [Sphingomonadaceae bacterium]|nr:class I SAM-dependent methyltransferase [Sphingomonadaceae bacterium]
MGEKPALARVGPVHFQALESELAPIVQYLTGNVLNAGCGNRDLGLFLAGAGAHSLTNYDIASDLPGAIIGPLEHMPFADAQFDSLICNAVIEHVADSRAVMAELARVLRPGGHAVIAIPFLQPFHPCPGDYRRFTADGLAGAGQRVGLAHVESRAVHGAAQTLGWIAWEIALEKGPIARAITFPIVWLWTRLSHRNDPKITRNANTVQMVFVRT